MPDQISVSEFLSETTEDYNSPTTSSFTTRLQSCRNTVNVLEEVRPLCQPGWKDGWMDGWMDEMPNYTSPPKRLGCVDVNDNTTGFKAGIQFIYSKDNTHNPSSTQLVIFSCISNYHKRPASIIICWYRKQNNCTC